MRIAKATFDDVPIVLHENPYLEELLIEINNSKVVGSTDTGTTILYVCEPIADHAFQKYGDERHWGYTERDSLEFFLKHSALIDKNISRIIIRPHPSEQRNKYDWARDNKAYEIDIGGEHTLLDEILRSDIVVGCQSMAMIVALLADKKVISAIPENGLPCPLPHSGLLHLKELIRKNNFNA